MSKTKKKTYNDLQLDQRLPYRSRWEMWHENKVDKRKRPKSTRFILEDEEAEINKHWEEEPVEEDEDIYPLYSSEDWDTPSSPEEIREDK